MELDSLRVDELQELLDQLPEEYQPAIRKEDFSLIPIELCPDECALKDLPPPVETEEVLEAHATINSLYTTNYREDGKEVLKYKRTHTVE